MRAKRRYVVCLAAALAVTSLCLCATAGAKIYFMSITAFNPQIAVANSTGQIIDSEFIPTGRRIGECCDHTVYAFGLATDGPHLFWSNSDENWGTDSSIGSAKLDDNGEPIESTITQTFALVPGQLSGIATSIQSDGSTYLYYLNGPINDKPHVQIGQLHVTADGDLIPGSQDDDFITGINWGDHVASNEVTTDDGRFTDLYWSNRGTDSIGHARVDSNGALVGTPDPLAVPPNLNVDDWTDEPDVWGPSGVAARDGYLYWADADRRYPEGPLRGDGHQIGRVAIGEDGLPFGEVEKQWITGRGSAGGAFTGTQTPTGLSTDGAYLYWANFGIPFWSDQDDDIGRAPLVDPMGTEFRYSFVRTGYVTAVVAMRDVVVAPSCPTSKEQVVHCTVTVKDPVAAGAHAPVGRVSLQSSKSGGSWDPGPECLLSVVGPATSTCTVDYDRAGTTGELITAAFPGDTVHSASKTSSALLPVPVDQPGGDGGDPVLPPIDVPPRPHGPAGSGGDGKGSSKKCKGKKAAKKKGKKCKKRRKK